VTLIDFLLARIAEDEEVARSAFGGLYVGESQGTWTATEWNYGGIGLHSGDSSGEELLPGEERSAETEHITRWDPARVVAECEAKRQIVAGPHGDADSPYASWETDYAMRFLAAVYADHPDYQQEWKP
jgi:hypothetical protein